MRILSVLKPAKDSVFLELVKALSLAFVVCFIIILVAYRPSIVYFSETVEEFDREIKSPDDRYSVIVYGETDHLGAWGNAVTCVGANSGQDRRRLPPEVYICSFATNPPPTITFVDANHLVITGPSSFNGEKQYKFASGKTIACQIINSNH